MYGTVRYGYVRMVGLLVGWFVGWLQLTLARKTSRVSEMVVCTVKYYTVDSIANAQLSILVRPMSNV
jgi:hypothetical protein